MSGNLPMAIPKYQNKEGYVYFIRFHHLRNCYKIGSTKNLLKRLRSIAGGARQGIELIAYGYSFNRTDVEFQLQMLFHHQSNYRRIFDAINMPKGKVNYDFWGSSGSIEYFIFTPKKAKQVIAIMKMLCASVAVCPALKPFEHKPYYSSLMKEEDLDNYYDEENCRFLKYPTQFTCNGWPIYEDRFQSVNGV